MNPRAARRGEIRTMPYTWPEDTDFALWELDVVERQCPSCGRMMHVCGHRYRRFPTRQGPVELLCRLNHCPDPDCPGHARIKSPELEVAIALPKWAIGWDVLCWIGHRRCSRHWAIPPDPRRTPRRLWYPSLGGLDRAVHPSLSSDAR